LAELSGRTQVGVAKAKAKASGGGFWGWMSTPAYPYYSSGGYCGGSAGFVTSYGGGCNNMSPNIGGSGPNLGGYVISPPGGGNGNFTPNIGGRYH
jgi:hypothetical protein